MQGRFRAARSDCSFRAQPQFRSLVALIVVVALAVAFGRNSAADESAAKPTEAPHAATPVELIEAKTKALQDKKDLDPAHRQQILDTYAKALERLKAADEFAAKAREWAKQAETAPSDLEKVRSESSTAAKSASTGAPPSDVKSSNPAQMQQALVRAEAERDHRQQELADLTEENESRSGRRREVAQRDDQIETELREVRELLEHLPQNEEADALAEAQQTLLQARRKALVQEQEMFRQELLALEATGELVTARRDLAAARLQAAEEMLDAWQNAVNERRRIDADRQLVETQQRDADVNPALRPIADDNVALATLRSQIATRIEGTMADLDAATTRLDELREQFERVTERAKKVGFTEAIGLLLRKQRDALPVIDASLRNTRAHAANVSQLSIQLTDFEEQRAKLADIPSRTKILMREFGLQFSGAEIAGVERELGELLTTQRDCLDALIRDTTRYVDELMELETVERQLAACVAEFSAFSKSNILWIRSTNFPQRSDVERLGKSISWLVKGSHWRRAARSLFGDLLAYTPPYTTALLALVGSFMLRRRLREQRSKLLARRRGSEPPTFVETAVELADAALTTGWMPAIAAFLGMRLWWCQGADEFVQALGRSLVNLAMPWFVLAFYGRLIVRYGAGATHFGWDEAILSRGRRAVKTLTQIGLPLGFLVLLTEAQWTEGPKNSLGRLAFVSLLALCASTAHRLWRSPAGPKNPWRLVNSNSWSLNTGQALRLALVAGPILLAAASLAGYHYTATQLAERLAISAEFVAAMVIVYDCLLRCVRLAIRKTDPAPATAPVTPMTHSPQRRPADLSGVFSFAPSEAPSLASPQFQRLVKMTNAVALIAGGIWIWSEIIPVTRILHAVEVYPRPFHWNDPATILAQAGKIVNLEGLCAAFLIAAVSLAAIRNVNWLLDLTLHRRVALDAGARYAVAAICRYAIGVAGLLAACGQIGIGWAQLNWLVAAMTVGLGFGLQEIFANFVSGLILLFERPVRIGDIVSTDGVTGTVTRIRIRATTITDGDMRELLVPNKELITGRVINWTLSNTIARMTMSVRTGYDVDPDKARNLLLTIAAENPLVLKQPPPQALFDEFSDKTLNFTLHVFMASCGIYAPLRHELLTTIQRRFRQAGIPFDSSNATPLPVPISAPDNRAA